MGETTASIDYIAAAANRYSHSADLSPSGSLVAFGSHKFVALWDSTDEDGRGVPQTLPGHEGIVTCVRFISSSAFVSADDKGVIRCWRKLGSQFRTTFVVQGHEKSISAVGYYDRCLVTGASDSLVKVWNLNSTDQSDEIVEGQTMSMHGKYPLAIELTRLPQSNALILAISGTLRDVKIYTRSDDNFLPSATLPGHEDWIRGLSFRNPILDGEPLVLASGSQDSTIRLWNVEPLVTANGAKESEAADDLLDSFEASLGDLAEGEEGGRQISLKRHILSVKNTDSSVQKFSIMFDALLVGHESHITSVSWQSAALGSIPTLLSTSTDSSLIIWSPSSSLWINQHRFGDIGGQRLGGFIGGLWGMNGKEVLAWGWNGGWRRWRRDNSLESVDGGSWSEVGAITGHNNSVKDICWSPRGEYLLSASVDQTTRIHGPMPTSSTEPAWHEISRPQVHGYDLVGVQFIDALTFVSVADEKVARVFEAPRAFVQLVNSLQVASLNVNEAARPLGASVPPLGLSNKAVGEVTSELPISDSQLSEKRRPSEGELASTTLWPEVEKVFGHGYELISVATSMSKSLFATSCKSSSPTHALVRINDINNNYQLLGAPLEGHALTITRIAFRPPDDKSILSVSRDRTWRLFEKQTDGNYILVAADKSHGRIVWDCAWSSEGDIFATASRDKTVKIWHLLDSKWTAAAVLKMKEAATAVAFSPTDPDNRRRLAVGIETGMISIYSSARGAPTEWKLDLTVDPSIAHIDQIHRLAWRPSPSQPRDLTQTSPIKKQLASCSEDHTLRILSVQVTM